MAEEVDFNTLKDHAPFGQYQYVDVIFGAAYTDTEVQHTLAPSTPEHIDYEVVRQGQVATVYHDMSATRKPWRDGVITLRSNIDSARVTLRLSVSHKPRALVDTTPPQITPTVLAHTHAATDIVSGTLADARLSTNVPLLNAANNFTQTQTISPAASSVGLILQGASSPSTALFRIADSGAQVRARVDASYDFYLRDSSGVDRFQAVSNTGAVTLSPTAATIGLLVQAAVTPSANPIRVQDSAAGIRWRIDQNFDMFLRASGSSTERFVIRSASGNIESLGDIAINTNKFNVTASNGNISNAGVATLNSIVVNTAVSTWGNVIAYDGANQLFIGVPGTTSAKKVTFIDSAGNALFTIDGTGAGAFVTQVFASYMGVTDGITAPGSTTGQAKIYVDTADGDLKVVFGDGTVKTIVTDT